MWRRPKFVTVWRTHVRGNNVIRCVAHPQLVERKATNSFVSCGCLTVDREYEF